MVNEAGYVIDQAIELSKGQIHDLRKIEDQVDKRTSIVDAKENNNDKLIKELDVAKKALTEVLQKELRNQAESTGKEFQNKTKESVVLSILLKSLWPICCWRDI